MDSIQAHMPTGQQLKRIYFSPDGIYNQINLNTLYDHQKKQYILDEVEIHPVVNTKQLVQSEPPKAKGGTAALFGRPAFSSSEFVDLPGTEKEIDQIDKYLRQNNYQSRVYKQTEATEENLRNVDSPYILHLATHGFFENNAASSTSLIRILLNSGIALSSIQQDKDRDDGILTAYEALNLNLDANELTVLSACETGLGEFYPGEGVYGLRLALTSAGARYVMMSLWKVDDHATQELMILFYKHWLKNHDNIRLAFQRAQQELRKKYPDPYYWGAFVLTGR
jgi:CHAT domain-containing protein